MTVAQMLGAKQARVQFELKDMGDDAGMVRAVFSTFDIEDRDGDIVRQSAFADQNGKEVPLVWSHNWSMPVGKGSVTIQEDRAIFEGKFFLETEAGQEAYKSVRAMGSLQEWSMGFMILEATPTDKDAGDDMWYWGGLDITKAELFEVSPVLVGANPQTRTLAVKGGDVTVISTDSARRIEKSALSIVAIDAADPTPVAEEPAAEVAAGKSFSDQLDGALAAFDEIVERGESIQAMRAKADRSISPENVLRLTALAERLTGLIDASKPSEDEAARQRQKQLALRQRAAQLERRKHTMGV